jgi:nuclear transport factor 2 (NTF2) superfamily protein
VGGGGDATSRVRWSEQTHGDPHPERGLNANVANAMASSSPIENTNAIVQEQERTASLASRKWNRQALMCVLKL